jgi:hypothetical protein
MEKVMEKSESFKHLVDLASEDDYERILGNEYNELKQFLNLEDSDIEKLILENDISKINEEILEVLYKYVFENLHEIIEKLNRKRNLTFKNSDNISLNDDYLCKTCICSEKKCENFTDAFRNYHPYCMKIFLKDLRPIDYDDEPTEESVIHNCILDVEKIILNEKLNEKSLLSLGWLYESGMLNEEISRDDNHDFFLIRWIVFERHPYVYYKDLILAASLHTDEENKDIICDLIKLNFKYNEKPNVVFLDDCLKLIEYYDRDAIKLISKLRNFNIPLCYLVKLDKKIIKSIMRKKLYAGFDYHNFTSYYIFKTEENFKKFKFIIGRYKIEISLKDIIWYNIPENNLIRLINETKLSTANLDIDELLHLKLFKVIDLLVRKNVIYRPKQKKSWFKCFFSCTSC